MLKYFCSAIYSWRIGKNYDEFFKAARISACPWKEPRFLKSQGKILQVCIFSWQLFKKQWGLTGFIQWKPLSSQVARSSVRPQMLPIQKGREDSLCRSSFSILLHRFQHRGKQISPPFPLRSRATVGGAEHLNHFHKTSCWAWGLSGRGWEEKYLQYAEEFYRSTYTEMFSKQKQVILILLKHKLSHCTKYFVYQLACFINS